jgi:hypothetical protein
MITQEKKPKVAVIGGGTAGCVAAAHITKYFPDSEGRRRLNKIQLQAFNKNLFEFVLKIALFVSWHYANGSCFDTAFWRLTKSKFEQGMEQIEDIGNQKIFSKFKHYLQSGAEFDNWQSLLLGSFSEKIFWKFSVASFYEVGQVIGYFS